MAQWVVHNRRASTVDAVARAEVQRALAYQGHQADPAVATQAAWAGRALSAFAGVFSDERLEFGVGQVRVTDLHVDVYDAEPAADLCQVVALYALGSDEVRVRFSPARPEPRGEPPRGEQHADESDKLLAQVVLKFEVRGSPGVTVDQVRGMGGHEGDDDTGESIRLTRFVVGGKDEG